MIRLIEVLIFLALAITFIVFAFKFGSSEKEKKKEVVYNDNLDKMMLDIQAEILRRETTIPGSIEENEKKVYELKSELERIKVLKNKFN